MNFLGALGKSLGEIKGCFWNEEKELSPAEYKHLAEEDFKYKGEWIEATTESNLMFSCLEMCGEERIGIVYEPIVIYTKRKDNTRKRKGDGYQNTIFADVINRPKKELHENTCISTSHG